MELKRMKICGIPSVLWGENSKKVFIAVHGNMSNKEDEVIKMFANLVTNKGYQVISFDLPEHGERKNDTNYLCKVQNCVNDLRKIVEYAKENFDEINLWACSMGAYFSLLAYKEEKLNKCIFLSPVVNMKVIIDNMMKWGNITEEELKEEKEIKTNFGPTLYWDYYKYVKENPIVEWNKETNILYGSNDNMQEEDLIRDFVDKFNAKLTVLENGEHYFHTKEQLEFYKNWLDKIC
ncbi:MAG: alpha/beta hydrolase [Clostridia bacterium]|nr:alpha/beta hydrolase [Clostridia bacterium]